MLKPELESDHQPQQRGIHYDLRRRKLLRPNVAALLVVADELTPVALGDLFHQERCAAVGALLRQRPVPQREVAVRIVRAAKEHSASPRLPFDDVAAVLGAEDTGGLLLDVFARRVAAARRELAKPALLEDQVRVALRALLVEDLVGLRCRQPLLGRDDLARRLALRVAGAGQELPNRPRLSAIGLPQFSQFSSISPPSAFASGVSSSRVFSHSG